MSKICINCKYCEQGSGNSFCGNKNQKDEDLKKYTYWPFTCDLFEEGVSDSREKYSESINKKQ